MTDAGTEELEIKSLANGGDGVGHLASGMTVFVPCTIPGERVSVRVISRKKRFARGELVELLSNSPDRVEPRCGYFGQCGGCQYQHLSDEAEYRYKCQQLSSALLRLGGLENQPETETVPLSACWNYRNKITLHRKRFDEPWGYFMADNQTLLPIDACPIAADAINDAIGSRLFDGEKANDLLLRVDASGQVAASTGDDRTDVELAEELFGFPVYVPQAGFYQVNPPVLAELLNWLKGALADVRATRLVDAYCGVGVFSLALSPLFEDSVGVESYAPSVPYAVRNASAWGVSHAQFIAGDIALYLDQLLGDRAEAGESCILLDPPRSGGAPKVIERVAKSGVQTIVYVACDPSALARDLKTLLATSEYRIDRLACFNMFPQTSHLESVAILKRR